MYQSYVSASAYDWCVFINETCLRFGCGNIFFLKKGERKIWGFSEVDSSRVPYWDLLVIWRWKKTRKGDFSRTNLNVLFFVSHSIFRSWRNKWPVVGFMRWKPFINRKNTTATLTPLSDRRKAGKKCAKSHVINYSEEGERVRANKKLFYVYDFSMYI